MLDRKLESLTLKHLRSPLIREIRPDLAAFADRKLAGGYREFVDVLIIDIERIIARLEMNPGFHGTKSEDQLSTDIVDGLTYMGYDAAHDAFVGGHCDISVRDPAGFLWLGEAKIHSTYDWLTKGFNQLSDRYSPGTPNVDEGGLIIYIPNKNALAVMHKWAATLVEHTLAPELFTGGDCIRRRGLAFNSIHEHSRTGRKFKVRHMGVVLNFQPTDAE